MATLQLYLLGPPQAEIDDSPVDIQRRKVWALLVYLAVTGETQRRDTLAALLWPDSDQSGARAALTRHLSELRKVIGQDSLTADRETVGFTGNVWLDVNQFQQLAAECFETTPDCLSPLTEAVALYRDDFLTGFTLPDCPDFDEWQFFQTEGLRRQLALTLERLIEIYCRQHNFETAIPYARRWLNLDPLHEPAHQQLMKLYAWSGQWAAALRQYETCFQLLETELGVLPASETEQLYQTIKTKRLSLPDGPQIEPIQIGNYEVDVISGPPQVAAGPEKHLRGRQQRHNLPPPVTPFIGREKELAELDQLLATPNMRLMTIVGPGGMGKTRLALAVAENQLTGGLLEEEFFPHGIYFVSLAPLSSTEHIIPTIAEALRFQLETGGQTRSPRQQILDYLRQKRMLIVMDNFEHLLDGVDIVAGILQVALDVQILVTSRERLHLHEEQVYPIQGLEFPDWETPQDAAEYTAVRLFMQSAQRVQPKFELATDDLTYLTRICRLVEGMPLGIELAASWVDTLSLAGIAAEIQLSLDLLETDVRNIPERHRSIRAVFDYSWQLMSEAERDIFVQLSIFRGGFTRRAAQTITGASLRVLGTLTSKSHLQYNKARDRYQIHELLRQYAVEKLVNSNASVVRDRHCAYYCKALQQREAALKGPDQLNALAQIEADLENVRIAWDWGVRQRQTARLEQGLESLSRFYEWKGRYQEGETACRMAADIVTEAAAPLLRTMLLIWQATFSRMLGQSDAAHRLLEQSQALLDKPTPVEQPARPEQAVILLELGRLARGAGNRRGVRELYEQSLAEYEALNDRWGMGKVLTELCFVVRNYGPIGTVNQRRQQLEQAEQLIRRSLRICREIGDQAALVDALTQLAVTLYYSGRFEEFYATAKECVNLATDLGMAGPLAYANVFFGFSHLVVERSIQQGQVHLQLAVDLARDIGYDHHLGVGLYGLGILALTGESFAEARSVLEESVAIFRKIDDRHEGSLALGFLGYAERGLGNISQARQYLTEVLRIGANIHSWAPLWHALPLAALLLADQGQTERAVQLYALHVQLIMGSYNPVFERIAGRYIAAAAKILPPEVVAAAQERGRNRNLWEAAEEMLAELEKGIGQD